MSETTSYDNALPNSQPIVYPHSNAPNFSPARRVWCVAPFPDNRRIVIALDGDSVIVYDLETQQQIHWPHKAATAVAVSPDGKWVVSGDRNGVLYLWDAESDAHPAGTWKQHEDRVWSVVWSPDGSRIASCSADDTFVIWEPSTGEVIHKNHKTGHGVVRAIAYCPTGGKVVTSGNSHTVKIWDDNTGGPQAQLNNETETETETVPSVAWTKDGNSIISGSINGFVRVWNIAQLDAVHKIKTLAHDSEDAVDCIAVSDHVFATASTGHIIYLWDLKTYHLVGSLACGRSSSESPNDYDEVRCVALTADENTVVAGTERGEVYTFDIRGIVSKVKEANIEVGTSGTLICSFVRWVRRLWPL